MPTIDQCLLPFPQPVINDIVLVLRKTITISFFERKVMIDFDTGGPAAMQ
jgi:hypothetical protein